jgi:hypothetical protein
MGVFCFILCCIIGIETAVFLWLLKKDNTTKNEYKKLIFDILNTDFKTRKIIEKNCNDYLEHQVINKFASKEYLNNCKLILDRIKYLNLINAIEQQELKEKTAEAEIEKTAEAEKKAEKKGNKKRGDDK